MLKRVVSERRMLYIYIHNYDYPHPLFYLSRVAG